MRIRAVVFDIGQTLVEYALPLNWSGLYRPAFEEIEKRHGLRLTEAAYVHIGQVLTKYNTRITPRDREVSSDEIFSEILSGTGIPAELKDAVKEEFYGYFRRDAHVYPEAAEALKALREKHIVTATLSDVAYGMDNKYALEDIRPLLEYIDYPCTSNDTLWRKSSSQSLLVLADRMGIPADGIAFVGDEIKDMRCAKGAGAAAVLINRTGEPKDYGQDEEITDLREILRITGRPSEP